MNIAKFVKYIFALLALSLASCASEPLTQDSSDKRTFLQAIDGKIVVSMSLSMPEMRNTGSRALTEQPDYNDMHLYAVEFDDNGSPMRNTLKTVYKAESETPQTDRVNYKLTINQTDQPRILHLIVLPKNEELNIDYGVEATVIPSLTTSQGVPAYWRRLTFPNGYGQADVTGRIIYADEIDKLQHVALIRNFASISVRNNTNGQFILSGFAVINDPQSGTIAPFHTGTYSFPQFLDSLDNIDKPLPYTTLSQKYNGVAPAGLAFNNPDTGPIVNDDTSPKYIYERPFNSIRHTYIIVKGRRIQDEADTYYKLDIGKNDDDGVFRYYNLLRNYQYNIVINNVGTEGAKTPLAAAQGLVYNNFSFDIEFADMLNISDGSEIVYVNFTSAILTDETKADTLTFKYRYRVVNDSPTPTYNNEDVNLINLKPGEVIESVERSTTDDKDGWRTVTIVCKPAETETKTQSFIVVKKSGVGRTIDLVSHKKWNYRYLCEYSGELANWDTSTTGMGVAGPDMGDPLTIFFDIPDNLPEVLFPITFTLESDHQNVENDPVDNLVVSYGPSGFSGVVGSRIKYQRIVTWTNYNDLLDDDLSTNGTAIKNPDGSVTHRIRSNLRTITALTNLNLDQSHTRILITNENFERAIVEFDR